MRHSRDNAKHPIEEPEFIDFWLEFWNFEIGVRYESGNNAMF